MNLTQEIRPKKLSEIIGHDVIVKELINRTKLNKFPSVMYFTGISGVGKTTFARIMSKNILCNNKNEENQSCNVCEVCLAVDEEKKHREFSEYNASNIGIDEMRYIADISTKFPVGVKRKVIIIDELQELHSNQKAQKNILKILENKNPKCFFILGSMDHNKVDSAIVDRTIPYVLNPLSISEVGKCLYNICLSLNIDVDKSKEKQQALLVIANNCNSMRKAISFLERAIYSDIWSEEKLHDLLNLISIQETNRLINTVLTGNIDELNSFKLSTTVVEPMRKHLLTYYSKLLGKQLHRREHNEISSIYKEITDTKAIQYALDLLFALEQQYYISYSHVLYAMLKILEYNKK